MDSRLLKKITADIDSGCIGVLCTIIEAAGSSPREAGTSLWVTEQESFGTVGGGRAEYEVVTKARAMLHSNEQTALLHKNLTAEEGLACGGSIRVYFEKIGDSPELFIFGGGHVGRALAQLAPLVGFSVTVWDDRPDCITEEFFPHARRICCPPEELFADRQQFLKFHANVYCVAVTRGHRCDADVLRFLYGKTAAYIGMIGSKQKNAAVVTFLSEEGISAAYLDSVYKPIGLPIAAETPEEIAVSIMAEIIAVKRGGNVPVLRSPYCEKQS
ncbi:MAG: XdhC family protein [Treponema sp.]